jgi:hypothetical protein
MKLLIAQFSAVSCHLIPVRPKYSPHIFIMAGLKLKMFLLQGTAQQRTAKLKQLMAVQADTVLATYLYWTQNICKPGQRHSHTQ